MPHIGHRAITGFAALLVLASGLLMQSCTSSSTSINSGDPMPINNQSHDGLAGADWRLISSTLVSTDTAADIDPALRGQVTLRFITDSTFIGSDGCNDLFGSYGVHFGNATNFISFSNLGATKRACKLNFPLLMVLANARSFDATLSTLLVESDDPNFRRLRFER